MGLNVSHDCWDGAYSAFMRWRKMLAKVAGLPPLELMEGFYVPLTDKSGVPTFFFGIATWETYYLREIDSRLPIKWDCLKKDPIHELLNHSDCDGEIPWESCDGIAESLQKLLPKMPDGDGGGHIGNWKDTTAKFIAGLKDAFNKKEDVEFR